MLIALLNTLTGIKIHQSEYSETDTWLNVYLYQLNVTVIIYFGVYFILLNGIKWTREFHHHHHHDFIHHRLPATLIMLILAGEKSWSGGHKKGRRSVSRALTTLSLKQIYLAINIIFITFSVLNLYCQYNHTYRYHNTNIFNELYLQR